MSRVPGVVVLATAAAFALPAAAAKTPEQIFQQASQSVIVIHAYDSDGNLINQGGGVVTAREVVTTNCHVIERAASLEVQYRQQAYSAIPLATNEDRDLCQIRVPQLNAPRVTLNTGRVRVGQRVYAIGAPEGLELTLTEGLISSLREFDGSQYIQTSAGISQGSSGGGLFDTEGRLIGITAFFVGDGPNLNFALPAAWIVELERGSRPRAAVGGQEPAESRWLARIGDARAKKDWTAVVSLSQQWVRGAPKSARAWRELGDAYAATNRPRRAIPAYQQAVRYDGDSFDTWHNLGWTYLALNQYDRAIESIQEALRITPGDTRATYNLGAAYYGQGQREKVQEIHTQLRKLDPALAGQFAKRYVKP